MALPNYSPEGKILIGSVPWDNSYNNVRLYTTLEDQYEDIVSRMVLTSENYTYIGRNRRLKVSIEADKLYHCNYCMYRNNSLTDGYIYCFITDVRYVNDHTSEIELETDVFNTYLYGVDWSIPPCFIERETVPSESSKYLLTNEPDFPLIYEVDAQSHKWFKPKGFVVMTCGDPQKNSNLVEDILNPNGYWAKPAPIKPYKGIPNGAGFYYCPIDTTAGGSESLELVLNQLTYAGSIESVVAVFTVPDIGAAQLNAGFQTGIPVQDTYNEYQATLNIPGRGNSVDGYTPRNSKLLYYPYNFARLTDYNGSISDLRYELLGSLEVGIKYAVSPSCQAIAVPKNYQGIVNFDAGLTVACGAQGSWANNTFTTWLAQNAGMIALTVGGIALAGVSGAASLSAASRLLGRAGKLQSLGKRDWADDLIGKAGAAEQTGKRTLAGAGAAAAMGYQSFTNAAHQPTVTRGQTNYNVTFATGAQGVHAQKVCVKAEIAQQIDQFFDRFGYAVERIEQVNINSRPAWNYVKTGGAAPKSTNKAPGSTAPFTRGRGTPSAALDVIRSCFDNGVTFWHTTSGYGNYSQANGV